MPAPPCKQQPHEELHFGGATPLRKCADSPQDRSCCGAKGVTTVNVAACFSAFAHPPASRCALFSGGTAGPHGAYGLRSRQACARGRHCEHMGETCLRGIAWMYLGGLDIMRRMPNVRWAHAPLRSAASTCWPRKANMARARLAAPLQAQPPFRFRGNARRPWQR